MGIFMAYIAGLLVVGVLSSVVAATNSRVQRMARRRRKENRKHEEVRKLMDYDTLFAAQKGKCAICGEPWTPINPRTGKKRRKLHRDHDRVRMIPRGLLCYRCNGGLRTYMTLAWLRAAAEYLEKYE